MALNVLEYQQDLLVESLPSGNFNITSLLNHYDNLKSDMRKLLTTQKYEMCGITHPDTYFCMTEATLKQLSIHGFYAAFDALKDFK